MTPVAQAVTAPEVPGRTRPRRLDLLTVSAEAPELVQHPLIAAEEVCTCPWSVARRSAPCRGLLGYQDLSRGGLSEACYIGDASHRTRTVCCVLTIKPIVLQAKFGKQLSDFLAAAKAQREALLDLSADTQLQVQACLICRSTCLVFVWTCAAAVSFKM